MKGNLMKGKMKGHFRKGKKGTVHELEFIQDPNVFSNFFVFFNCFFVGQVTQWVTWSNIELSAGSARSANKWKSFSKKTLVTMSWLRSPLQTPAPAPPYNRSAPFLTKKTPSTPNCSIYVLTVGILPAVCKFILRRKGGGRSSSPITHLFTSTDF